MRLNIIQTFMKSGKRHLANAFHFTYRYIDEIVKLYDKRDNMNFKIVNFPYLSGNIYLNHHKVPLAFYIHENRQENVAQNIWKNSNKCRMLLFAVLITFVIRQYTSIPIKRIVKTPTV